MPTLLNHLIVQKWIRKPLRAQIQILKIELDYKMEQRVNLIIQSQVRHQ